jgi:hypothetical protein
MSTTRLLVSFSTRSVTSRTAGTENGQADGSSCATTSSRSISTGPSLTTHGLPCPGTVARCPQSPLGTEDDNSRAERRGWLGTRLEHAAGALGVATTGKPVFGWHDRTTGTQVNTADGERWLRVVAEMSHWAGRAFWTGNLDTHTISGVPKPRLLTELDWSDGDCQLHAELMTLAPSPVIANDMVLRSAPDLAPSWWADLRRAVDALAAHPTERVCIAGSRLRLRLLAAFSVEIKPAELEWTCAHGDLHWANLTAPHLCLLGWKPGACRCTDTLARSSPIFDAAPRSAARAAT